MNETLIARWNDKVKGHETIYILGDMFFRCEPATVEDILKRLKGKKHLIQGNHDGSWLTKIDASKYFESIELFKETSIGQKGATLCHYPMLTYKHAQKQFMIHGHIHNDTRADFWPLLAERELVLNAGVDVNNFEPVTLEELIVNNKKFKEKYHEEQ